MEGGSFRDHTDCSSKTRAIEWLLGERCAEKCRNYM